MIRVYVKTTTDPLGKFRSPDTSDCGLSAIFLEKQGYLQNSGYTCFQNIVDFQVLNLHFFNSLKSKKPSN